MTDMTTDRNVLLGLLGLRMNLLSGETLASALKACSPGSSLPHGGEALEVKGTPRPLGEYLVEAGALSADSRSLLEALLERHLQVHGGDAARGLEALGGLAPEERELLHIAEPDLLASLSQLPASPDPDLEATRRPAAGKSGTARRFRILRPHASGGLGEVFIAQDEELNREVAVKQLHLRHADSPEQRQRFQFEAAVCARLEHAGIVPVYGRGSTEDDRPYLAMRLVHGVRLDEAMAKFHQERSRLDRNQREFERRRLLLRFLAACHAVAYAHERGVLHRDIKPGDILVGAHGQTLLIDWGLAKLHGFGSAADLPAPPPPTQQGTAPGTPAYMSPEQAAGRLDQLSPASDVYSLGATLYHLLTGRPPFEDTDAGLILQKVQRGDLLPPRRVDRTIAPALEAVCRKAMALRPEDRYATAAALAEDVERWLAGSLVSAYRTRGIRRRWAAGAGVGVVLAAIASMAALAAHGQSSRRATAARPAPTASEPVPQPDATLPAGPAEKPRDAKHFTQRGLEHLRLEQYEEAMADYEEALRCDPASATAFFGLGIAHFRTGQWEKALAAYSKLVELQPGNADGWYGRAQTYAKLERWHEADSDYSQALKLKGDNPQWWSERSVARFSLRQFEKAAADDVRSLELRPTNVATWNHAGQAYYQLGQWDKAIAAHTRAIEIQPGEPRSYVQRGLALNMVQQWDKAVADFSKAIELKPDDATHWVGRGLAHQGKGAWDKAAADFSRAVELNATNPAFWVARGNAYQAQQKWDMVVADYSRAIDLNPQEVMYWNNRGNTYYAQQEWEKATTDYSKAIQLRPRDAVYWNNRGNAYAQLQRWQEADSDYSHALELKGDDPECWNARGVARSRLQKFEQAAADYARSLELRPQNAVVWDNAGRAHYELHQWDKAIIEYSKAIELKPQEVAYWNNRGNAYHAQQNWDKAIADYSRAIELKPGDGSYWNNRGNTYYAQQKWDKATADYSKAIERNPKDPTWWSNRGQASFEMQQWENTIADYSQCIALQPMEAQYWNMRSVAYIRADQADKACADLDQAIRLQPEVVLYWRNRAVTKLLAGRWPEAAEDYARVVQMRSQGVNDWFEHALVQLHQNGPDAYRRAYTDMVSHFSKAEDPEVVYRLICAGTLLAGSTVHAGLLERLAKHPDPAVPARAAAMVACRAGEHAKAIRALEKAVEIQGKGGEPRDWLFLALAHAAGGDSATAQQFLARAALQIDKEAAEFAAGKNRSGLAFWRFHELRVLRKEAEQAVGPKKP
jgi:tetratricopeptide (TPR) repeat protein